MGLLGDLFDRFKKQPSLWDLKLDDLNRERITLQQEQHKLDMEADRLHKDEIQLKSEYGEAQTPTQKKIVARKIQNTRLRSRAVDSKSAHCHKLTQTVNNFILIKDNMEFFDRMGVSTMLTQLDSAEIETYINEATIEGTLQQEKLANMLQQVGEGAERITEGSADGSLEELMAELDGETGGGVTEGGGGLKDVMKDLDAAIAKGEQAARQAQTPAAPTPAAPAPTPEPSEPAKPAAEPDQED